MFTKFSAEKQALKERGHGQPLLSDVLATEHYDSEDLRGGCFSLACLRVALAPGPCCWAWDPELSPCEQTSSLLSHLLCLPAQIWGIFTASLSQRAKKPAPLVWQSPSREYLVSMLACRSQGPAPGWGELGWRHGDMGCCGLGVGT